MAVEPKDSYTAYRGQIQYEDGLFNQRITWMIAFEALLWSPYATLAKDTPHQLNEVLLLKVTIIFMGLGACILALFSCCAANLRITRLKVEYRSLSGKDPAFQGLPQIDSERSFRLLGSVASHGFIFMIAFAWAGQVWGWENGEFLLLKLLVLIFLFLLMLSIVAVEILDGSEITVESLLTRLGWHCSCKGCECSKIPATPAQTEQKTSL